MEDTLSTIKAIQRTFSLFLVAVILSACATFTSGNIVVNGNAQEISLKEHSVNGLTLQGYDIYINSEYVGRAKRLGPEGSVFSMSDIRYAPVNTRYGVVEIIQKFHTGTTGAVTSFDVKINNRFVGNVHQTSYSDPAKR